MSSVEEVSRELSRRRQTPLRQGWHWLPEEETETAAAATAKEEEEGSS